MAQAAGELSAPYCASQGVFTEDEKILSLLPYLESTFMLHPPWLIVWYYHRQLHSQIIL